jgi:hypothetical protein
MKVVVVSGERQVSISAKGNSPKMLREMEATANRLLKAGPEPAKPQAFGFSCVSETQIAAEEG